MIFALKETLSNIASLDALVFDNIRYKYTFFDEYLNLNELLKAADLDKFKELYKFVIENDINV